MHKYLDNISESDYMHSKDNWICDNLTDRRAGRTTPYKVTLNIKPFEELLFDQASENVARELDKLYHRNIFIALSGGTDSSYIVNLFHRLNIPFTTIIIEYDDNSEEVKAANDLALELKLNVIYVNVENEGLKHYIKQVIWGVNGVDMVHGLPCVIASKLIERHYPKSVLILGDHLIGDGDDVIEEDMIYVHERSQYGHVMNNDIDVIDFFLYTPELSYSMIKYAFDRKKSTWAELKAELYKQPLRKKIRAKINSEISEYVATYSRRSTEDNVHVFGPIEQLIKQFEDFVI